MPTVLTIDGFRIVIYTHDHWPPHVHVFRAEEVALFFLGNSRTAPLLRINQTMKPATLRKAFRIVTQNQGCLLDAWSEIHG